MNITIQRFKYSDNELFAQASKIRNEVFCIEQGVEKREEFDGLDNTAEQYLLFVDNQPVATSRWRITPKGVKLERYAVQKEFRGLGVGKVLLNRTITDTISLNLPIYLHAQISAEGFYLKNGFVRKGDNFIEADIVHCTMFHSIEK